MATQAQIRANRLNAQRSTGPRTEAGKQTCRVNSLKHGLTATRLVLATEDPAALNAIRDQLKEDYRPATEIESMLVEEIAQCWFRLQRARAEEREVLERSFSGSCFPQDSFNRVLRYMSSIERAWHRAVNQLRAIQKERRQLEQAEELKPIGSVSQEHPQAPLPPQRPLRGHPPLLVPGNSELLSNPLAPAPLPAVT